MHSDQTVSCVEVKAENEFSDEVSRVNTAIRCSVDDASMMSSLKKRAHHGRNPEASETSNILSLSSSHDSITENAESKAALRSADTNEDAEMLPKVSLGEAFAQPELLSSSQGVTGQTVDATSYIGASDADQRPKSNESEVKSSCNGNDISCVSGADGAHTPVSDLKTDADGRNAPHNTASVGGHVSEGFEKSSAVQSGPDRLAGAQYERRDKCNNVRGAWMFSDEYKGKDKINGSSGECVREKSDPSNFPLAKDCLAENTQQNLIESCQSQSAISVCINADSKMLGENSFSQNPVESPMCSLQYVESSKKQVAVDAESSDTHKTEGTPELENSKSSLVNSSSSGIPIKDVSCLEAEIVLDTVEPTADVDHLETNEHIEAGVSPKVPSDQNPSSNSQFVDASEESEDIVEDDVKVCDICGDAGREESLAICSKCSDGAEHTYCMRIMMDKVPDGDWLCELCQLKEEAAKQKKVKCETIPEAAKQKKDKCETVPEPAKQKKDKCETVPETPKVSSVSEQREKSIDVLDSKISLKSDAQFSEEEVSRATKVASSPRFSSKRHSDNAEVPSAAKRQALESSSGSPVPSSPSKANTLSRERSFKNLEKGKVKPVHSMQDTARSPTTSVQNSSKIHPPFQTPRGTLLKSSSFNASNPKPKVKMVQEDVHQKHKLGKHPSSSGSRKEGLARAINKSSSFNIGSSHSTSIESKAKANSSSLSRAEDLRGVKQGNDRNITERKNSFKSDRLTSPTGGNNVLSPKDEHKFSSRGEPGHMPSAATKFRDLKAVQADSRSTTSKSTSPLPHRGPEIPNTSAARGDSKRHSSFLPRGGGYSSFTGSSAEQKPSHVNTKDETAADILYNADVPRIDSDVVLQDGLPQSRKVMDQGKKGEVPSFNQPRQSVPTTGKHVRCSKCKGIGHGSLVCPSGGIRLSVPETTTARNSREMVSRSTKFSDANEVSFVKSSGMGKKSGLPDQSGELSTSNTELICDKATKSQFSNLPSGMRNFTSSVGAYDRQESSKNSSAEMSRATAVTSGKHSSFEPCGGEVYAPKATNLNAVFASDGNQLSPSLSDPQHQNSSVATQSRVLFVPKQEYIWQGGFEVQRSGTRLDSFDGIQAHLSSCASPKVLEVGNKLPHNVLLEEVSRASTWPTQFQNCVTEDNIGLYFFPKDAESYNRSYQSLVENMMKNDLALRGLLDGIELLIFPSNQLCQKSKQWNKISFLWGVFRGKRMYISEKKDDAVKNISAADLNVAPMEEGLAPATGAAQDDSSSFSIDEESSTVGRSVNVLTQFPSSSSSDRADTNNKKEESSSHQQSSPMIPTSNVEPCADLKGNGTSMLEHEYIKNKEEAELRQYTQEARDSLCLAEGKTLLLDKKAGFPSASPGNQETCSGLFKLYPEEASSLSEATCAKKVSDERMPNAFALEDDLRSNMGGSDRGTSTWGAKSSRKRPFAAVCDAVPQASGESSACTSQLMDLNSKADDILADIETESKKMRVGSETYSSSNSRDPTYAEMYRPYMLDLGSSFLNEQKLDRNCDGPVLPGSSMTAERHFFPVESGKAKATLGVVNSIPVEVISSDDEDPQESEFPNLDLALGEKKKASKQRLDIPFDLLPKKRNDHGKCPEIMQVGGEDDSLGSLSLSLAVPFSSKMGQIVKPAAKPERERKQKDTSLVLFSGLSGP